MFTPDALLPEHLRRAFESSLHRGTYVSNAGEAFLTGSDAGKITAQVAVGTTAVDGNKWKQVN